MAQEGKMVRRLAGMFSARLPELQLDDVADPRHSKGKRWRLSTLLAALVVGLASGCKSLALVEALTAEMSRSMRRLLGIRRRLPDTTMRDVLDDIEPSEVRSVIHRQTKAAHRRKALLPIGLPFGVLAMDGKSVTSQVWDWVYARRHRFEDSMKAVGLAMTMTCTLISSRAKVCIDAIPIPARTNESGQFKKSLKSLIATYGTTLFKLITYDAGGCSESNARAVVKAGLHYLFGLKYSQPFIRREAGRWLGHREPERAEAETVDVLNNNKTVTRRLYTIEKRPLIRWNHLRTFLRVESETLEHGKVVGHENRYFISSLERNVLTPKQWLLVIRNHWNVENQCHNTWDRKNVFDEDNHPWIESHPRAMVVLMLLRRIAYNMLELFRTVTQRSQEKRQTPWRDLMRWIYNTVIAATDAQTQTLRKRKTVTAFS